MAERQRPQHLRVFLSSPGDVAEERTLARRLIKDDLPYDPIFRGRVTCDVVSWDDPQWPSTMLGFCCNDWRKARMAATWGGSGGDLEQLGDEAGLGPHVAPADAPNLPLPDHRHRLVAGQRSSRRVEAAEAEAWSDQAFWTPMILLDDVVQELGLA